MFTAHFYTSDEKIEKWGYGEWVEEPDYVCFFKHGLACRIARMKNGLLGFSVAVYDFHLIFKHDNLISNIIIHGRNVTIEEYEYGFFVSASCYGEEYVNIKRCYEMCVQLAIEIFSINTYLKNIYALD